MRGGLYKSSRGMISPVHLYILLYQTRRVSLSLSLSLSFSLPASHTLPKWPLHLRLPPLPPIYPYAAGIMDIEKTKKENNPPNQIGEIGTLNFSFFTFTVVSGFPRFVSSRLANFSFARRWTGVCAL